MVKKSSKKKRRNLKRTTVGIVTIVLLLILLSAFFLLSNNKVIYEKESRVENTKKMRKKESEVLGWLRVQGTNIDYPIIDATKVDNFYDLDFDFLWKNNSNEELEDKVTIIGHNIRNVSNKPIITDKNQTRFEQLPSFVYYDFAKKNKYIQYTIGGQDYIYKIYSVTFSSTDEVANEEFFYDNNEKEEYIKKMKKNSLFDYDVDVNAKDKLISLITCTRMFGSEHTDAKIKVEGRLLRSREKAKDYGVKTSKSYDKLMGGSLYEKK